MKILPVGRKQGRGSRDLTNDRFGSLVAVAVVGRTPGRHFVWECRCDCGATVRLQRASLVLGHRTSCGCAEGVVTGQRFGALVVTAGKIGSWLCKCDCGGEAKVTAHCLLADKRKTCGNCTLVRAARGMRFCPGCTKELALELFGACASDTLTGKQVYCLPCSRGNLAKSYRRDIVRSRLLRRVSFRKYPEQAARAGAKRRVAPYKHAAQMRVYYAVKRGELVKPGHCSRCPETHRIEGHHDDYSRPLDVMWLCTACHRVRHRELRELGVDPCAAFRSEAA